MPYLTPETVPDTLTCRALLIPDSAEWLAIFSGAITELTKRYNWEQQGVSVDDAVQVAIDVVAGYYDGCVESGCNQPGGYALLRTNPEGHVEQLINGEWVEPQGENAFPPVPARTEPTEEERRCLAAANCANALAELYEQVSEVAAFDLGVADLIILLVAGLAARFFWIAPIINGILLIAAGILELLIQGARYATADVWDSTFDDIIKCMLYECSSDSGDVVTFDYNCLMQKLYDANVLPPWNEQRARLAAQLALLISVVGGVDALNQLGATTAITEADCDNCAGECGLLVTFEPTDPYSIISFGSGTSFGATSIDSGFGEPAPSAKAHFGTDNVGLPGFGLAIEIDLGAEIAVAGVNFRYWYFRDDTDDIGLYVQINLLDDAHVGVNVASSVPNESQGEWHGVVSTVSGTGVRYVQIRLAGSGGGMTDGDAWLDNVCINPPA